MAIVASRIFLSYSTTDEDATLKLANDLKRAGQEFTLALDEPRIAVVALLDSDATLESLPRALVGEVSCRVLGSTSERDGATIAAVVRQAWGSLQINKYLVSPEDHILGGPLSSACKQ
jgi:hypothetical protein